MISEIDLLKEDIPCFEKRFGTSNLFVEVLKAQLESLQNPNGEKCQRKRARLEILDFLKSLATKK